MTKSSLMSRNDPFMSDHQSIMAVDPNYFLNDIGSSVTKGTDASIRADDDNIDTVCPFCFYLRSNELTDCLLDEGQDFSTFPSLMMEWVNMDDSQLENMILSGFGISGSAPAVAASTSTFGNSVGTSLDMTPSQSPDHDFEQFLNDLKFENELSEFTFDAFESCSNSNSAVDLTPPLTPVHQAIQGPLSVCLFESGIANFEEVSSSLQQQMSQSCLSDGDIGTASESFRAPSPASTVVVADLADIETFSAYSEDSGDADSVHSFSSTASTLKSFKRKVKVEEDDEEYLPPSKKANKGGQAPKRAPRKAPARRNRRVQDERVKNQNKVAAMKYRAKKRDEKSTMDVLYEAEEEKNKKLKSQLDELQVNIDVLKELLGKYLKK